LSVNNIGRNFSIEKMVTNFAGEGFDMILKSHNGKRKQALN